jgi:L-cysteine:1D-myo-inositol 2-amino-2-deoxy-alpha-D-glucopyranoside ligase
MHSWPSPALTDLPGQSPPLSLFDTATDTVRPTTPGRTASMYVCGITPYDATHVGHAATYVAFDLINRVWRDGGHKVRYAQNVTDVDDPLLERAVARGEDWRVLAERETELFRGDMTALSVLPPDHYIGAVEAIPAIVETIQELQAKGATYEVDGDIYFRAGSNPRFGEVSRLARSQMMPLFAERGGDPNRSGKLDPLDPVLWQQQSGDDPGWHTELGVGRPGWHVECAAISAEYLGTPMDVQGGGRDLTFPHHEMCAAISQSAISEWPFARMYVHTGMVGYEGTKMSKSLGNLVFVKDLRSAVAHPAEIRLALLSQHYRSDWEWMGATLETAQLRYTQWSRALARTHGPSGSQVLAHVRAALANDLQTPSALTVIDHWAAAANFGRGSDTTAPALVRATVSTLLGVQI